jgi:hypothetical protein
MANLLAIADRDIQQSQVVGLGPEWCFDIAYNACLQLAVACLASEGYQAERQNKHQRTIECLAFTVYQQDRTWVDFLDVCRRKRHAAVYEQVGGISAQESGEMVALAKRMRVDIPAWIKKHHPQLLKR